MALLLDIQHPSMAILTYHRVVGIAYADLDAKKVGVRVYSYLTQAARDAEKSGVVSGTKMAENISEVSSSFFDEDGTPKTLSGSIHEILYAALKESTFSGASDI
jgi:hypothetical protein